MTLEEEKESKGNPGRRGGRALESRQNRGVGHRGLRQDPSLGLHRDASPHAEVTHPGQQVAAD